MKNEIATIVGNNIKRLREQKKWSQHDLASKTGGSFQQISKYERGENAPGSKKLSQFAELFGVDVSELTNKYDPSLKCSEPKMPYGDIYLTEKEQALLDFIRKFSEEEQDKMIKEIREKAIKELTGEG
ncbi:MAG: helix-turn-helix domain-containing protein [Geobacteraceae bacterium]